MMTAQDWYRMNAGDFGQLTVCGIRQGIEASIVGDIFDSFEDFDEEWLEWVEQLTYHSRLAFHFARLALGCEWTVNRDRNIGETSCDNWVLMEYHTRGSHCPFCGAPVAEAK